MTGAIFQNMWEFRRNLCIHKQHRHASIYRVTALYIQQRHTGYGHANSQLKRVTVLYIRQSHMWPNISYY